jgi:aspartyl-tRNA(Asn)/glutamyl-tRNA(Gln) amidotransferase subunit A
LTLVRLGRPVAVADAAVVARLRAAGAILIGRAAMSEFAYAGGGTYAHLCTPLNPFDRVTRRIPGGSSSGAAITVTDGVRLRRSAPIPAALCGLIGFKAIAANIRMNGVVPLAQSLDLLGIMA